MQVKMVFNDRDKKVFEKLEKITKELPEGEYNYEILSGSISNDDFDTLIEYIENEIKLVNSNPDSKQRFEITKKFFKKLQSENLYHSFKEQISSNSLMDAKKVSFGRIITQNFYKFENQLDNDEKIDAICKFYIFSYERACRFFFKPLANAIAKKKIDACGTCINKIIEFYPDMEFVLEPFIPQIRNSIDHLDYHYDPKKKLLFFDDREKLSLSLPVEQLRIRCSIQIASEVSMNAAYRELDLPQTKVVQQYFKNIEKYCKIVGIDFHNTVITWVSTGRNLLRLHNALEKMIKDQNLSTEK